MSRSISYLFLSIWLVTVAGCSAEQKLAQAFVKMEKPKPLLIMKPSFVYKYNLKEFEILGIDSLDSVIKDSLLQENTLFLKEVSGSALIDNYISGFSRRLRLSGYKVLYEESFDSLMTLGEKAIIIHLAQMSLEEYIHPFTSEEQVYDEVIVIDGIDLNAINFNAWIEISPLNGEDINPVLFISDYLLDDLNGTLKQNLFTGKFSFDYTIDTITSERIYEFAGTFGHKTAIYLYDYLMNKYIMDNLPKDYPFDPYYHHYDLNRRLIYPVGSEERFIELK